MLEYTQLDLLVSYTTSTVIDMVMSFYFKNTQYRFGHMQVIVFTNMAIFYGILYSVNAPT